ncbi:hypothetical protein P7266_1669 [Lactococcus cremoris]|nr:hypothetical protein P7266_1669 [Lactococcus cremoris]
MTYYSKTEVRSKISRDLPRRKFDRWLNKIQEITPYRFEKGIPSQPKLFKNGQPQQVTVFDDLDYKNLKELYDRVFYEKENLTFAIYRIFLSEEDYQRVIKGEWDIEEERKKYQ